MSGGYVARRGRRPWANTMPEEVPRSVRSSSWSHSSWHGGTFWRFEPAWFQPVQARLAGTSTTPASAAPRACPVARARRSGCSAQVRPAPVVAAQQAGVDPGIQLDLVHDRAAGPDSYRPVTQDIGCPDGTSASPQIPSGATLRPASTSLRSVLVGGSPNRAQSRRGLPRSPRDVPQSPDTWFHPHLGWSTDSAQSAWERWWTYRGCNPGTFRRRRPDHDYIDPCRAR
jgi:hypothetical protein